MTTGSHNTLVLGLGNPLLQDDGAGLRMLEELQRDKRFGDGYEFVDGGTQGIALLGCFEGRASAVILDAVALGAPPGTVHVLSGAGRSLPATGPAHRATAHEGSALEVLALARLLGELPEDIAIVGIEPEQVRTGIGLSERVEAALPDALARATEILEGRHVSGGTRQDH